jgi:hypothetical protein
VHIFFLKKIRGNISDIFNARGNISDILSLFMADTLSFLHLKKRKKNPIKESGHNHTSMID